MGQFPWLPHILYSTVMCGVMNIDLDLGRYHLYGYKIIVYWIALMVLVPHLQWQIVGSAQWRSHLMIKGGPGPPKIFEFFFFWKISLKFCKFLNNLIILVPHTHNIHIYLRKSKNKLHFHLNKIQFINTYVNKLQ